MLELYSYYRSSSSTRVRIALALKGLEFEYRSLHPVRNGGENNAPEYKKLNPQGMVPTLVDGPLALSQSMAIMEYLDEKHPAPPLLPATPEARAFTRQVALICSADIQPLITLRVANYLSAELQATQAQKTKWQQHWIRQGLDAAEALLKTSRFRTGDYTCGDHVTVADICLVAQTYLARRCDLDMYDWPVIEEIERRCLQMDEFQKGMPENQPDTPEDQRPPMLKGKG